MRVKVVLGMLAFAALAAAQEAAPPAPPKPPKAPTPARAPRAVTAERVVTIGGSGSYLGIGVAEITSERAKALKLKEERGAEVTSVTADSPAAKAGIKAGDVVLEYNGQAVESVAQFTRMVQETPADRQVKVVVWRNGGSQTLTATVGTRKGLQLFGTNPDVGELFQPFTRSTPAPAIDIPRFSMTWQNPRLGIVGEALGQEQQLADFFGVKEGVLVKSVEKNSAAEKGGVKAGDVIVKVGDARIATTEEITKALRSVKSGNANLTVVVVRNKKETPVTVTIEVPGNTGFAPAAAARLVNVQEQMKQVQRQLQDRMKDLRNRRLDERKRERLNDRVIEIREKLEDLSSSFSRL
jgi:serine protease Do